MGTPTSIVSRNVPINCLPALPGEGARDEGTNRRGTGLVEATMTRANAARVRVERPASTARAGDPVRDALHGAHVPPATELAGVGSVTGRDQGHPRGGECPGQAQGRGTPGLADLDHDASGPAGTDEPADRVVVELGLVQPNGGDYAERP